MDVSTDILVDDFNLHDLTVCADGHGIDGIIQHEAGGLFVLTDIPSAVRDALKRKTTIFSRSGSQQSVFLCKLAVIRAEQSNQRTAESVAVFINLLAGNRTVDQIIFDCLAVVSGNLYNCRIIYTMLKTGTPYNEECFEQRRLRCERKRANRLVNELQKLGYVVVAPD